MLETALSRVTILLLRIVAQFYKAFLSLYITNRAIGQGSFVKSGSSTNDAVDLAKSYWSIDLLYLGITLLRGHPHKPLD